LGELGCLGDAERVAADLLESIRQPIQLGKQVMGTQALQVSASMGIAIYPDDGADCSALWRDADTAMYRAKQDGGSRVVAVSRALGNVANEAEELEIYMRRMLEEGGFELHYQPQYSMAGQICGIEALLRLTHPRLGAVPPARFIPIAESTGLIVPLGEWVLEEVCRQSRAWKLEGFASMRIAFNVSSAQFVASDFAAHVMRALARYEVDPLMLEIEIGEGALMLGLPEVARQMQMLAAVGIHFSVDDFGTAYSSVSHLHQLPVSTLKIDRSFVEQISASNGTYSIIQAIIALGHSLGLQVVAEGVERGDQVECLRALGCNFLQGHLFAHPMPASRVTEHMAPAHPILYRPHDAKRTQPAAVLPHRLRSAG
jgi:EAL domain-containing protein (putative c-di-GMP-specific phosphodiesterase class I)